MRTAAVDRVVVAAAADAAAEAAAATSAAEGRLVVSTGCCSECFISSPSSLLMVINQVRGSRRSHLDRDSRIVRASINEPQSGAAEAGSVVEITHAKTNER